MGGQLPAVGVNTFLANGQVRLIPTSCAECWLRGACQPQMACLVCQKDISSWAGHNHLACTKQAKWCYLRVTSLWHRTGWLHVWPHPWCWCPGDVWVGQHAGKKFVSYSYSCNCCIEKLPLRGNFGWSVSMIITCRSVPSSFILGIICS